MADNRKNLASVIPTAKARNELQVRPVSKPGAREILVRNHAIAVNPVDWKIQDYTFYVTKYPNVLGSDVAGIVEEVGSEVKHVKKGDRVTGYSGVIWNQNPDEGAFQTYTILQEMATTLLPASISFEEAASFPMQLATVGSIVFLNMGIKLPSTDTLSPDHKGQGLLIYGASSAVGTTMIQVAKQLGFTVFAIASAKNEKYVKSLGADHFIARDNGGFEKEVVAQIKNSGLSVRYGVDCISTGSTYDISASILSQTREAKSESKLVTVLPWPEDKKLPEGVTTEGAGAFKVFNSEPKVGAWLFNTYLTKQLKDKTLTPSPPVQIVKGGLKSTQEAWDLNKQGVSAKKLVLLVDDE